MCHARLRRGAVAYTLPFLVKKMLTWERRKLFLQGCFPAEFTWIVFPLPAEPSASRRRSSFSPFLWCVEWLEWRVAFLRGGRSLCRGTAEPACCPFLSVGQEVDTASGVARPPCAAGIVLLVSWRFSSSNPLPFQCAWYVSPVPFISAYPLQSVSSAFVEVQPVWVLPWMHKDICLSFCILGCDSVTVKLTLGLA